MGAWRFWRSTSTRFFKRWGSYVTLIFLTNLAVSYLAVPVFTWLTGALLNWQHVPYVSYSNVPMILEHPVVVVGLLAILLAIVTLVYWQFSFILLGVRNIAQGQPKQLRTVLRDTIVTLQGASISTFLFFLGYFIIIVPFGSYLFTTPLLNKAKIPDFIVTYLTGQPLTAVALGLFYLVAGYVGVRLINVLPLMILGHESSGQAVRKSWRATRHHFWRYVWKLVVIVLMVAVMTSIPYLVMYAAQLYFDTTHFGIITATLFLFLMEVWSEFMICYSTALFAMLILASYYGFGNETPFERVLQFTAPAKLKRRTRGLIITGLMIVGLLMVAFNVMYLNGFAISRPILISHRGVDDGNGVQNTIPALVKTSKEKPAYVEMDIHETKDHQFVVMHDENLATLAGVNKAPYQLTLKQMQRMTVRENGYVAKIPSFDDYFNKAIQLHQKLLIEIKVTPHDSKNATQLFIDRYADKILAHHDRIHTLDYNTTMTLKRQRPQLFVSYIMPYNLTFPNTPANAYTMEVTTLTDSFVDKAQKNHQQVFAWDIDDTDQMDEMMFMGVNGVITDNLKQMQTELKDNTDHPSYANLLLTFMNQLESAQSESQA